MTYSDADTPNSTQWWTGYNTVSYDSTKTPVSMAGKYPIADINQTQAIDSCKKIWAHLITNSEWMTIARNIEEQKSNYISWWPWNWILKNWVSDNTDLGCNKTWWNADPRAWATKTWSPCDWWKNKLKLSNWEYIYDFSWNVWEHVNKANTIDWSWYNVWQTSLAWSSNWTWRDDDWILSPTTDMDKYVLKYHLWTANWMWNIYSANWIASNIFLRGAGANEGIHAGVFTLHLSWISTYMNRATGFRCVTF